MKVTEIVSTDNQKLKLIRSLIHPGKRKDSLAEHNLILLEGQKVIEEALHKRVKLHEVIISQSYYQDGFDQTELAKNLEAAIVVKDSLFKGLYTTDTTCGIIATAVPKYYSLDVIVETAKTIILADNIQDPGNLGTIIRTAFAFEAGGLVLSKGCVDPYSPKVIRSSMGSIFSLPLVKKANLISVISEIKEKNFCVIALASQASQTIWQNLPADKPVAYILGNEGHGISEDVLSAADRSISIPINPNSESLNVAIAAGIILAFSKFQSGR